MKRILAIDFETANASRSSACSIGYALIENGEIIKNEEVLINPEEYFDPFNISIHGITEEMVEGKPTFPEAWEKYIKPLISQDTVIIAHNAGFDIPNNGEWIGFDMEKQDWVAPAGKGKIEDFAVNLKWDGKQSMYSDLLELRVRFSRDGDGYYYGDKTYGSAFSGVYQVDTNQCLQTELVCKVEKVDGGWKETGIPNGKLMVVRSRTTLDQHGAVIDTNYSVIRSISIFGGWHGTAEMGLNYQFNPIPNNTNLEPKR